MNKVILVHIGKCGGSSLRKAISKSGNDSNFQRVHIAKPPIFYDRNYGIVCRGPISRALSAFNWRYKLVIIDEVQKNRFLGEREVLKKYGSLNNLAESLYIDGVLQSNVSRDFLTIHHLYENISFYLKDLLDIISPDQIKFVISQESLDADIKRILGVELSFKEKAGYEKISTFLSDRAVCNLRNFLQEDYQCIMKLFSWGKISKESFIKMI